MHIFPITGTVAPSGRLADTWPIRYGDALADKNFPAEVGQDLKSLITPRASREGRDLVPNIDYTDYDEGIYVGYRYFTTSKTNVAYPFGYGLTYTYFSYDKASVEASADGFMVLVTVRNTGSMPGREVVQLYVSAPAGSMDKPVRELKGFAKTGMLAPGESETVEIPISLQDLASWNEKKGCWETARGIYHFCFGKSAEEMLTDCSVQIKNKTNYE